LLGRDPTKHIIVVSYSHDFASELHRQFRKVVDASWYQTLYPGMRPAKDSGTELVTTAGGGRYATAAMTGQANDYSVCTTWKKCKKDYFLIDVFRARLQYPDLRRMVASLASRHAADTVLIEDAGPGMMLLQDLQREIPTGMNRPIGVKPEGSKADRMVAQSAKIEAGHVYLPRKAEWLDSFLLEVLGFPQATHDDQIDSVSQFLKWASTQALYDDTDLGFVSVGFNPVQNW